MAHVPPNQAPAPSAATAFAPLHTLTESEQNELRAHGLDPHHVRIADGAHVKGEQRDAVVSLLAEAREADVRHLLRRNREVVVSAAGDFLTGLRPPSGQQAPAKCIVVEVVEGTAVRPVAVEVVEFNVVDRALRVAKGIEAYRQAADLHPGGLGEVERAATQSDERATHFHDILSGTKAFFEQYDIDVLYAHEAFHADIIGHSTLRHHIRTQ
jgi:hypothetical protein